MSSGGCLCGSAASVATAAAARCIRMWRRAQMLPSLKGLHRYTEGSFAAEGGHGCNCGSNCQSDSCNC